MKITRSTTACSPVQVGIQRLQIVNVNVASHTAENFGEEKVSEAELDQKAFVDRLKQEEVED